MNEDNNTINDFIEYLDNKFSHLKKNIAKIEIFNGDKRCFTNISK